MDRDLQLFFRQRQFRWRRLLLDWERRTRYRREALKRGEAVRAYTRASENPVRQYANRA